MNTWLADHIKVWKSKWGYLCSYGRCSISGVHFQCIIPSNGNNNFSYNWLGECCSHPFSLAGVFFPRPAPLLNGPRDIPCSLLGVLSRWAGHWSCCKCPPFSIFNVPLVVAPTSALSIWEELIDFWSWVGIFHCLPDWLRQGGFRPTLDWGKQGWRGTHINPYMLSGLGIPGWYRLGLLSGPGVRLVKVNFFNR